MRNAVVLLQVFLKSIDIGAEWGDPVGIEGQVDVFEFVFPEVGGTEVYFFIHSNFISVIKLHANLSAGAVRSQRTLRFATFILWYSLICGVCPE